jgi:alpha-ketoglutarate-dependent taurine dioxygenase
MKIEIQPLPAAFGAAVHNFNPSAELDAETVAALREAFDRFGVLVFRDLELPHYTQVRISTLLIGESADVDAAPPELEDNFYISNTRPNAAAPSGRLQFHADTMWAERPFEVLSLYGLEVDDPVVPTIFISGVEAWRSLPTDLKEQVRDRHAMHTAGEVRRGDLTDVLLSEVARPPTTVKPVALTHPRTGDTVLYVCEQMTREIVGMDPADSERLLETLFDYLYDPANRWHHDWRTGDLLIWDNISLQHARPNVTSHGPARTLRKVAYPIPQLALDQLPSYNAAS